MRSISASDEQTQHPLRCHICGRALLIEIDPLSGDCGGDCWGCIGLIEAEAGGDPSSNISIDFVAKEIKWGWRGPDGTPRPQSFFMDGGPRFIRVRWLHSSPDYPAELWSELNERREEIRKIEIWADGRVGYALENLEIGGTRLGKDAIPLLDEIAANPEFDPEAISDLVFQQCWDENVR